MTKETPAERVLRARIAALHRLAQDGADAVAATTRRGFRDSFLEKVREQHPDLPLSEQRRRARFLFRAHMARMTLRSLQSRRGRSRPD